jgi:Tol biopolymer transport system component/imidazolonepropionase-like amidohydrolase
MPEIGNPNSEQKIYKVDDLHRGMPRVALIGFLALWPYGVVAARTLDFDTNEVTQPGITATPSGRFLIFNLLGHLFEVPVSGGAAKQLTFGPYYDSDPVVSPDGKRVAFISNRDGGDDGNLYVLELSTGQTIQLTHEFQAGSQVWSPDGKTIAFLSSLRREEYPPDRIAGFGNGDLGYVKTVSVQGGPAQRLTEPQAFLSVFYFPDGRLGWIIAERPPGAGRPGTGLPPVNNTTIEARDSQGNVSRVGTIRGGTGRIALDPEAHGFYYVAGGSVRRFRFGNAEPQTVAPFRGTQVSIDASRDGTALFVASDAKLWRIALPGGSAQEIAWQAHVKIEVAEPTERKWTPPAAPTFQPRAILTPRLSPDGKTLVFMAAGALWEQAIRGGGEARKLLDEPSFQLEPAFSPDGKQIAFVSDKKGARELRVLDLATRGTHTLVSAPGSSWLLSPAWSADQTSITVQKTDGIADPYRLLRVPVSGGNPTELARTANSWTARPQLTGDGNTLYYTARAGKIANLFRLSLRQGAQPESITHLSRHVHDSLVSPDGKWVAFRRNTEIWLAHLETRVLNDQDFHRFSGEGGRSFGFTPDSSTILYSEGAHVWRQPVAGGPATEIAIHLTLKRAVAPPLLISNVKALDVSTGKFSANASILIDQGRIAWIGAEPGHNIPANVNRIKGGGRYAIPGLTDSHMHTAWANQQTSDDAIIAYGITSVRDTGSRLDMINALKDQADSTSLPIPRYFASGDIFEGLMPLWGDAFLEIATEEEGREYVKEWKMLGADFIKVYDSLPWNIRTAIAGEAHHQGLPLVGHGLSGEQIIRSVILGFSTLEHNGPSNDDIRKLLAASSVRIDPTLTIFMGARIPLAGDAPALDAKFRAYVPEGSLRAARPGGSISEAEWAGWRETLARISREYRAGVKLLDGTDALMTGVFFGPSLHYSLQYLNSADVTTADVLRIATVGAAETEGSAAELGTLAAGKFGDVLLLDGNPLEDIKNTMKIWRVVKAGNVFDPAAMR